MRDELNHSETDSSPARAAIPPSRALVRFERRSAPRTGGAPTSADFLAQLIACRSRVGAYRDRRREDPEHALTCYRREPKARAEFDLTV